MTAAQRLDHLDFLRGAAAILVLAGHLRGYLFASHAELAAAGVETGLPLILFYFATGLGHQAVIVFFALSGYLVGGKALADLLAGRFAWSGYLLRRLTRLWIVIVPALLLTVAFDLAGMWLSGGAGYDGTAFDRYSSGPGGSAGVDHSALTFAGNLFFLQTIAVPVFGSNSPIWSLANEFWYYLTVPLAAWLVLSRAPGAAKAAGACGLLAMIVLLPVSFLPGAIVWTAGAAAAWVAGQDRFDTWLRSLALRTGAVLAVLAALAIARIAPSPAANFCLGVIVAMALPVLAKMPSLGIAYQHSARAISEISYTLYLTHFPLLTMIALGGLAPTRLTPGLAAFSLYGVLISIAVLWAAIIWWLFERNTDRVYSHLRTVAGLPGTASARALGQPTGNSRA
jgi:peptidoglycan/LPS O-acetylase OafA/YrhL